MSQLVEDEDTVQVSLVDGIAPIDVSISIGMADNTSICAKTPIFQRDSDPFTRFAGGLCP
jgi:hypothetical protein